MKIVQIIAVIILALLTGSHAYGSVSRGVPTTSVRCQLDTVTQVSTVTTHYLRNDTVVVGFPLLTGSQGGLLWPNNATMQVGGEGNGIPTVSAGACVKKGVTAVKEDLLSRIFMEMGLDSQVPDAEVFRGWGYECRGGVGAGLGDVLAIIGVLKGERECGGEGKVLGKAGSARVEVYGGSGGGAQELRERVRCDVLAGYLWYVVEQCSVGDRVAGAVVMGGGWGIAISTA